MNDTENLIVILNAIYKSLGDTNKSNVIREIGKKIVEMNSNSNTSGQGGASQLAEVAKNVTGYEFRLGSGFSD